MGTSPQASTYEPYARALITSAAFDGSYQYCFHECNAGSDETIQR